MSNKVVDMSTEDPKPNTDTAYQSERRYEEAIGKKRASAGQMQIEGLPEGASLQAGLTFSNSLVIVSQNSIHQIRMADDIDPKRTNILLENSQQKILSRGSSSPAVYKTLLTAEVLLKSLYNDMIDKEQILKLSLDAAKDISAILDQLEILLKSENEAAASLDAARGQSRQFIIPSFDGIDALVKSFAQRADHVLRSLLDIVKVCYGDQYAKGYFEGFRDKIFAMKDEEFAAFLTSHLVFTKYLREFRNAIEHPKPDRHVVVRDYSAMPDGNVRVPTLDFFHPNYESKDVEVSALLARVSNNLGEIYEGTLAYLVDRNAKDFGIAKFKVFEVPEKMRKYGTVRYELSVVNIGDIASGGSDVRSVPANPLT